MQKKSSENEAFVISNLICNESVNDQRRIVDLLVISRRWICVDKQPESAWYTPALSVCPCVRLCVTSSKPNHA